MISEISENVAQDFATLLIRTSREECTIYPFASEKADLHRDRRRDAGRVAQDPRLAELPAGVERPLDPEAYVGSPTQLSNYLTLKGSFSAAAAAVDRIIFKN